MKASRSAACLICFASTGILAACGRPSEQGTPSAPPDAKTPGPEGKPPNTLTPRPPGDPRPLQAIPYAVSGSRLDALGYRVDGASQFRTFKDTKLGFECAFTPDGEADGFRCLPPFPERLVYLDAGCEKPAIWLSGFTEPLLGSWVSARSEAPPYPSVAPGEPEPPIAAFQVGEKVYDWFINGPEDPEVYETVDGKCVSARSSRGHVPPNVYAAVAVDKYDLVGAKQVTIAVTQEISITRLVAEDGAALTNGLLTNEGRPCELQSSGDCVPLPIAGRSGDFLDANCEESSFALNSGAPPDGTFYGIDSESGSDVRVYELKVADSVYVHELVLPIPEPPAEYTYTCEPAMSLGTEVHQDFAPAKDVTGSLPGAKRIAVGTGALRNEWFALGAEGPSDPVLVQPLGFPGAFVQGDGVACQTVHTADGSLRCAPLSSEADVAHCGSDYCWKDSACTERLLTSRHPSTLQVLNAEEAHFIEYGDSPAGTSLSSITGLSSLKAYAGPVFAKDASGTCSPDAAPSPGSETLLEIDEKLDLGLLPLVEEVAL